jgi:hypothetical protein
MAMPQAIRPAPDEAACENRKCTFIFEDGELIIAEYLRERYEIKVTGAEEICPMGGCKRSSMENLMRYMEHGIFPGSARGIVEMLELQKRIGFKGKEMLLGSLVKCCSDNHEIRRVFEILPEDVAESMYAEGMEQIFDEVYKSPSLSYMSLISRVDLYVKRLSDEMKVAKDYYENKGDKWEVVVVERNTGSRPTRVAHLVVLEEPGEDVCFDFSNLWFRGTRIPAFLQRDARSIERLHLEVFKGWSYEHTLEPIRLAVTRIALLKYIRERLPLLDLSGVGYLYLFRCMNMSFQQGEIGGVNVLVAEYCAKLSLEETWMDRIRHFSIYGNGEFIVLPRTIGRTLETLEIVYNSPVPSDDINIDVASWDLSGLKSLRLTGNGIRGFQHNHTFLGSELSSLEVGNGILDLSIQNGWRILRLFLSDYRTAVPLGQFSCMLELRTHNCADLVLPCSVLAQLLVLEVSYTELAVERPAVPQMGNLESLSVRCSKGMYLTGYVFPNLRKVFKANYEFLVGPGEPNAYEVILPENLPSSVEVTVAD